MVSAAQEEETGIFFFHSEETNAQRQAAQAVSSILPRAEGDFWTLSKPSTTFGYTAAAYADHKYWMRILLVRADDARWTGGALYLSLIHICVALLAHMAAHGNQRCGCDIYRVRSEGYGLDNISRISERARRDFLNGSPEQKSGNETAFSDVPRQ